MKLKDSRTDYLVDEDVLRKYLIRCHAVISRDYPEVAGIDPVNAAGFLIHLQNTGRIKIELFNETPSLIGCRIIELDAEQESPTQKLNKQ